jgi:hypothetical protein
MQIEKTIRPSIHVEFLVTRGGTPKAYLEKHVLVQLFSKTQQPERRHAKDSSRLASRRAQEIQAEKFDLVHGHKFG